MKFNSPLKTAIVILLLLVLMSSTQKEKKFHVFYTWNRYDHAGAKHYSLSQQGGYLIDSTLKLSNGIDTIYLTIENH